jgi:O-antigen ligase
MNQLIAQAKNNTFKTVLICLGAALLLVLSLFMSSQVLLVLVASVVMAAVLLKPSWGLALLPLSLFFEADQFSLTLPFGRVRLYHVLIVLLFARTLFDLAIGRIHWRKSPLDWPLAIYVALNWATVLLAPNTSIALKIAGLITLLALLYWTITNTIRTKADFVRYTRLLLLSTLAIALFGLFQVFAVWFASKFDITLWSGVIIHSDVIPYGRPYGTFVEPDWFGTIMAAALVGVFLLSVSKVFKHRQVELLGAATVLFVATVLSSVRGGWLSVLVVLPVMLFLNRKRLKLLDSNVISNLTIAVLLLAAAVLIFTPDIRHALAERVMTLINPGTLEVEPRFLIMQDGWELFLKHPLLGRGPGAYTTLGTIPFVTGLTAAVHGIENFQTNAILTVLIDTGLVGLLVVCWMLVRTLKTTWKALVQPQIDPQIRAILFALAGAGLALMVGYQVSTGIWLGLTWYLLSLIIVGSLIGHKSTQ